jgi:hypothetical protein
MGMLLSYHLLRFQENWTIPCLMIYVSLMEHAIKRFFLISAPASALAGVATSGLLMISSGVVDSIFTFLPQGSKIFLLVLQRSASVYVDAMQLLVHHTET